MKRTATLRINGEQWTVPRAVGAAYQREAKKRIAQLRLGIDNGDRNMKKKRSNDKPTPTEPANDQSGAIYTLGDLAKRWRVSRHTIEAAIRAGRLQAFTVNERGYRIREAEVIRYERQHMAVAS